MQNEYKSKQIKQISQNDIIKQELSYKKLILMFIGLSLIWILCIFAESRFSQIHEQQLISRMGRKIIDQQSLNLATKIKHSNSKNLKKQQILKMDKLLQEKYKPSDLQKPEQMFCIIIRDFPIHEDKNQLDQTTLKSILNQKYENYKLFYVGQVTDKKIDKIKNFFELNRFPQYRFQIHNTKYDTISSLIIMSQKFRCHETAIILILKNKEQFTSANTLKVLNSQYFQDYKQVVYANSLYQNDKIGFALQYSQKIKIQRLYKKYPFAANGVFTFRNNLLVRSQNNFVEHNQLNPLDLTQSYGYGLLEQAYSVKYLPEILTIKPDNSQLFTQKSQQKKEIQKIIRQQGSIIKLNKFQETLNKFRREQQNQKK